jgi:uncharacterized protein YceK
MRRAVFLAVAVVLAAGCGSVEKRTRDCLL